MASNIIPAISLAPQGWVFDHANKADTLLSHYYESMYSQSYVYSGNVSSLQYIVQQYGSDIGVFKTKLQENLERYLNRYYDLALVTVTDNLGNNADPTATVNINVYCDVSEKGVTYSIGTLLQIANSKVIAIEKLNN